MYKIPKKINKREIFLIKSKGFYFLQLMEDFLKKKIKKQNVIECVLRRYEIHLNFFQKVISNSNLFKFFQPFFIFFTENYFYFLFFQIIFLGVSFDKPEDSFLSKINRFLA